MNDYKPSPEQLANASAKIDPVPDLSWEALLEARVDALAAANGADEADQHVKRCKTALSQARKAAAKANAIASVMRHRVRRIAESGLPPCDWSFGFNEKDWRDDD